MVLRLCIEERKDEAKVSLDFCSNFEAGSTETLETLNMLGRRDRRKRE